MESAELVKRHRTAGKSRRAQMAFACSAVVCFQPCHLVRHFLFLLSPVLKNVVYVRRWSEADNEWRGEDGVRCGDRKGESGANEWLQCGWLVDLCHWLRPP